MNPDAITQSDAVRAFHHGKGNILYQLDGGSPAVLMNLHGNFGFCYLHKLQAVPKFRGVTASQAVANALKAGREVMFTDQPVRIPTP